MLSGLLLKDRLLKPRDRHIVWEEIGEKRVEEGMGWGEEGGGRDGGGGEWRRGWGGGGGGSRGKS